MPEKKKRRRADADSDVKSSRLPPVKRDFAHFLPVSLDSIILPILNDLRETTRSASTSKTLTPSVLSSSQLKSKILNLAESLRESIVGGSVSTVRKAAIILRVLPLIYNLSFRNEGITSKVLFRLDRELFKDQKLLESCLDDMACMLGCTWSSLCLFRGVDIQEGFVGGRLRFNYKGNTIDCIKNSRHGMILPVTTYGVSDMQSDAYFILLVEDLAAYVSLAEEEFYNRFPCVMITGNGKPEAGARSFLMKMVMELKLPVLALVDCDPSGLKNLSAYGYGTDIKWLGFRPSDFDNYNILTHPMTEEDVGTCKDLLKKPSVKNNPGWVKELDLMVEKRQKAPLYAVSCFKDLSEWYLPLKLLQKDWL